MSNKRNTNNSVQLDAIYVKILRSVTNYWLMKEKNVVEGISVSVYTRIDYSVHKLDKNKGNVNKMHSFYENVQ